MTTVIVTHDQEEAMEVADSIVVMNEGRIEQIGSPVEIYENPRSPFVMQFVGEVNVPPAEALHYARNASHNSDNRGGTASLYIRPHDLELLENPEDHCIPALVKRLVHLGRDVDLELQLANGHQLHAQLLREWVLNHRDGLNNGSWLYLHPRSVRTFSEAI